MTSEFTKSDGDLVFYRKFDRWIMLGVLILESFVFLGVSLLVLAKEPEKAIPVIALMSLIVVGLIVLTAWFWSYEVRLTPYEFVHRTIFGTKIFQLSEVVSLVRRRVKGKNPPQYQLTLTTMSGESLKVVDIKGDGGWLHEAMRLKCKSLTATEFTD